MAYKFALSVAESHTINVKYRKLGITIPLTLKYSAAIPADYFRQWAESELIRKFAAGWTRKKGTTSAQRQQWAEKGFTLDVLSMIVHREKAAKSPAELVAELLTKAAAAEGAEKVQIIAELEAALLVLKGTNPVAAIDKVAADDTIVVEDEEEDEEEDEDEGK